MVKRLPVLVVVALCIVGLGLAAASLSSNPAPEEGSGNGTGGDGGARTPGAVGNADPGATSTDITFLEYVFPVILAAMALSIVVTLYYDRWRVLLGGVILVALIAIAFVLADPPNVGFAGLGANESGIFPAQVKNNSSGGTPASESTGVDFPLALFGVVGFVVAVAAGAVVYASRSVDDATEMLEEEGKQVAGEPDPDGVADAAGRAADRIESEEGTELSNAVYDAFHEMTEAVDVANPAAATPREFATAAVTAGADPDPVHDLTEVFEAVRYDDEDPARYEDQAVAALRRIEADLSADHTGDADGGGDGS